MKTLKQKIEIMTAAWGGAKIEWISLTESRDTWTRCYGANDDNFPWDWDTFDYRISAPEIAPGHNPDKLTIDQVETHLGWRLLEPDEIKQRAKDYNEIQSWRLSDKQWNTLAFKGCNLELTYRTKLSREQLAALDNPAPPKRRLPLGPEDFPPGTVIRCSCWNTCIWKTIFAVTKDGVVVYNLSPNMPHVHLSYQQLAEVGQRSIDGGRTWLPCYKTSEQ